MTPIQNPNPKKEKNKTKQNKKENMQVWQSHS